MLLTALIDSKTMEGNDVQSDVLQRALARRFSLLEKTRIHRLEIPIMLYQINIVLYQNSNKSVSIINQICTPVNYPFHISG